MATKTLYVTPDESGWSMTICLQVDKDDETKGVEQTYVRWEMQAKSEAYELWTSSRGERAVSLPVLLNPKKFFDNE